MKLKYCVLCILSIVVLFGGLIGCSGWGVTADDGVSVVIAQQRLKVSTTTSLYDTGLWNVLEDRFEQQYNIRLDILYAGTGIALEYGKRGDVDVLAVHDKARELTFIEEGYGVTRVPFAYNYFVIAGPANDPANIKGLSPEAALQKLYQDKNISFISRGDDSGTHSKEKAIWKSAGLDYEVVRNSGSWYVEAGRGMGPTLLMARELNGYTLSDIGTFLAYKGNTGLVPVVDQGSILLNIYSIIAINPEKVTTAKHEMAQTLIDFLVSEEIQKLIGEYGVKDYGESLFTPCAGNEPTQ